ncbi:MAG: DUF4382 domain-containing protein [Parafilimonas sp.]
MKNTLCFLSFIIAILLISSCKKEDSSNPQAAAMADLSVRMTDAPASYDAVNIDIQQVEVTGKDDRKVNLNCNAGIYNLLNFSNGVDTLIARGPLTAGEISQIRLILGDNNSVVVDGQSYPLITPSAQESGLKVQVHDDFEPGVAYIILLDFDATESIVEQGNGNYLLKPVIRLVDDAISGSIRGEIIPPEQYVAVTATDDGVSYSTVTNASGKFLIAGVPPGTYTVTVTPSVGTPVIITNVQVTLGESTNLDTIHL